MFNDASIHIFLLFWQWLKFSADQSAELRDLKAIKTCFSKLDCQKINYLIDYVLFRLKKYDDYLHISDP